METKNYWTKLYCVYDEIGEEIITIGRAHNAGQYAREIIPNLKGIKPLNDLVIKDLGEICIGTGEIKPNNVIKTIKWQEAYKFEITNKSVENEEETTSDKKTDKE